MQTINLFGKSLKYKDYDCSKNPSIHIDRPPVFNLYIQITDVCNAKCVFCDKPNCNQKESEIDIDKLSVIVTELLNRGILGKVSITGGEPLINIDKLNKVLNCLYKIEPGIYVTLNTNGSYIKNLEKIEKIECIGEIDISRHHYDDTENRNVFGVDVCTLSEIKEIKSKYKHIKTKLNCVLQSGLIDNSLSVEDYLEKTSLYNINEVRFITLLNLTNQFETLYVNPSPILKELDKYIDIGYLYDKDICSCSGFMFVSDRGIPLPVFIRNTKQAKCEYLRQFVYTPQNNLLDGFSGRIII